MNNRSILEKIGRRLPVAATGLLSLWLALVLTGNAGAEALETGFDKTVGQRHWRVQDNVYCDLLVALDDGQRQLRKKLSYAECDAVTAIEYHLLGGDVLIADLPNERGGHVFILHRAGDRLDTVAWHYRASDESVLKMKRSGRQIRLATDQNRAIAKIRPDGTLSLQEVLPKAAGHKRGQPDESD